MHSSSVPIFRNVSLSEDMIIVSLDKYDIITGNQQRHQEIRAIVVEYLRTKYHLFVYFLERTQYDPEAPDTLATIISYIERSRMATD